MFPSLSDAQKTKLIFASIGIALLVFICLLARPLERKLDPHYGELVVRDSSIALKSPMPEARVKAPLGGWRLTAKNWMKNTAVYWYRRAGADEQTLSGFAVSDDQCRIGIITKYRQLIRNRDRANPI